MIMHPTVPKLNGQNLTTYRVADGIAIFVGMNKAIAAATDAPRHPRRRTSF
ncbi:MAG: hypothetical protein H6R00_4895 [Proteobacteria bacterium]|nr:hypothetical protein [Pseudomonadota bacterium]